jgi:hypothetical protein
MTKLRRVLILLLLAAAVLCGVGCQTFRASRDMIDQERDREVGAYVDAVSSALYWILQWLPYAH